LAVVEWPSITIVSVVYNRRDELRTSLRKLLLESDYEGQIDAIVVDNASSDGSAEMVRREFPQVELIVRRENIGAPAWNEGFAAARGDWVLISDDDCFLPPDGFRRAMAAAAEHDADLVSFRVVSTYTPEFVFSDRYRTGLFSFWGCSALFRREVIQELGGYDPEIFMWANELELTLRFFDRGYRHLHLPEVEAQHMKALEFGVPTHVHERTYRVNARHFAYIAAKLFGRRDALEALFALLSRAVRDGLRADLAALKAVPDILKGFAHGLRRRQPLRNAELSGFYRANFESFASFWWFARPPRELLRAYPREILGRQEPARSERIDEYYERRARYYPDHAATLDF
jgi:GT2 family glycosyltransferase